MKTTSMRKVGGILVLAMTLSCGSDLWAATQHRKYKTQIIEERPVTTYYRTREDSTERFARVVTAPVRVVGWVATAPFRWVAPKTFGGTDALMLERDDSVRRAPRYTSARRYERNRYIARPVQSRRVAVQRREAPRFVEVVTVPVRTAGWVATAPLRWVAPKTFGASDALIYRDATPVRRAPRYTSARRYERSRYVARPIQSRRMAVQRREAPRFVEVVTVPVRTAGWVATAPLRWVAPKTFGASDALIYRDATPVRRAPRYTSARRYERNRYVARPIQSRRVAVQRRDTPRFVEVAAVPVRTAGWVATAPFRWVAPRTFGETDALLPRETLRRGT